MPLAAVYIHIPFCLRRCAYCGFVSSLYEEAKAEAYIAALRRELQARAADCQPRTIYIGGGTPTCLSAELLARLFDVLSLLPLAKAEEWTIEANPGTLSREKIEIIKERGINRVSLGIQTFSDRGLAALGRVQDNRQVRPTAAMLREMGIENISADFIFGWPGQTAVDWQDDLTEALRLGLRHVSCYGLAYEEGTPLALARQRGALVALNEEEERLLFDLAAACLEAGGLQRYEISNFAAPGWECRHNLVYWRGEEYLGLGAGAHSHVQGVRLANVSDVDEYIRRMAGGLSAIASEERLLPERKARECAVIWLRLSDGIDAAEFALRTGFTLESLFADAMPRLLAEGWLAWNAAHTHVRLAAKSLPVADLVLAELI